MVLRRQALEVQQRPNRWITSGVIAVLAVMSAFTIFSIHQQNSTLSRVSAQQDHITLVKNNSGDLKTISRQTNPEVFYRVTLKDAPVGKKLALSCNWIDPNGQIVKQNSYQTHHILLQTDFWKKSLSNIQAIAILCQSNCYSYKRVRDLN